MTVAVPHEGGTPLAGARAGIDLCVHCGFCLQACPTYLALEDENDSPRGRLLLMRSLADGDLPLDDADARRHLDQCLGCRACETVCPSGVPYGQVLEAARETLTAIAPPPWAARLVLWLFARPVAFSMAMVGARLLRATRIPFVLSRLPGRLGFLMAMLDATRSPVSARAWTPRTTPTRESVAVLQGCVMEGLYAATNRATERALRVNGFRVVAAPGQRCCGALHAHAGDAEAARSLARRNIAAFEASGADRVAVNAAGCGAMMKEYGHLLAHDPAWRDRATSFSARVRDVSELLAEAGPARAPVAGEGGPIAYDAPCHLLHGQRVARQPLAVLAALDGARLVPLADAERCCGSAGIYNLVQPGLSDAVLAPKLAAIAASGAALIATGNPGCLMQIGAGLRRAGTPARTVHPVDLLDAAYARR